MTSVFLQALRQARQAAKEIAQATREEMMDPSPALAWLFWEEQEDSAILDSLTRWEKLRVRQHFEAVFTMMVSK